MHYYQHNIADYRKDTSHLTLLEHGIYRQLLDSYYLDEVPLSNDLAKLMRSHSVRSTDEQQALQNVLTDFFELTENGYVHKRCDGVIAEYHGKSDKDRASAMARWSKQNKGVDANALQTQSEGNANHKPITINHKPETKNKTIAPPDGVSPATWSDFLQVRKAKKAPVTAAAIAGIEREARKAQWSLEKALVECCARGWAGFKAEWVNKEQNQNKTQHQINQEGIARSLGLLPKHDEYQGNVIEGEIYDAEPNTPKRLG